MKKMLKKLIVVIMLAALPMCYKPASLFAVADDNPCEGRQRCYENCAYIWSNIYGGAGNVFDIDPDPWSACEQDCDNEFPLCTCADMDSEMNYP